MGLGLTLLFCSLPARAAQDVWYSVTAGARMHADHSVYHELPYDEDDISYHLGIEANDREDGYCQIGVYYTPDPSGSSHTVAEGVEVTDLPTVDTTDYVLTPHLDIIYQDGMFIGGIGILKSYVRDEFEGGDWTGLYWEFTLGLSIPVSSLTFAAQAYYVFEDWNDVDEIDTDDLDYGISLSYAF